MTPAVAALRSGASRLIALLGAWNRRWPWLVPLVSFASGVASYALVKRGVWMSQIVAAMAAGCALWLLAEGPLLRLMRRLTGTASPAALSYVSQALQQEILFFGIPFLIGATRPDLGQLMFTGAAIGAAVLTTIDPAYQWVLTRPVLRFVFHAWCCLVAALVALPLVAGLTVEHALPVALLACGVWLLLSLPAMWWRLSTRADRIGCIAVLVVAPLALFGMRSHVPPAGLVLRDTRIALSIDDLDPGPPVRHLRPEQLANGVIAYAAVQAPDGLAQEIIFEWRHGDQVLDEIPMFIHGVGDGGWRTFTRKRHFPADPSGEWRVDLRTPGGQLISRLRFTVAADVSG